MADYNIKTDSQYAIHLDEATEKLKGVHGIIVPGGFGVAETLANRLFTPSVLGGAEPMPAAEAATMALAMMLAYRLVQLVVTLPGGVLYLMRRTGVSPTHMRAELEAENGPDA